MKNKDTCEVIEIIQNATVVYTDDVKEQFEGIRLIDRGLVIGRFIDGEFVEYGYISKGNVKRISGGKKREIKKLDTF